MDGNQFSAFKGNRRLSRQDVIDLNLVDRYLLGQLSEPEAMAFEDFYAGSPETMAELEDSTLLIESMRQANEMYSDRMKPTASLADRYAKPAARGPRLLTSPWYSLAASVLAIAAVALLATEATRDNAGVTMANNINVPIIALGASRGNDSKGIEIDSEGVAQVALSLDVGLTPFDSYEATLLTADGREVWRARGLNPNAMQSVTMTLSVDTIPPGDYEIVVTPISAIGDSLRYQFSVR